MLVDIIVPELGESISDRLAFPSLWQVMEGCNIGAAVDKKKRNVNSVQLTSVSQWCAAVGWNSGLK